MELNTDIREIGVQFSKVYWIDWNKISTEHDESASPANDWVRDRVGHLHPKGEQALADTYTQVGTSYASKCTGPPV